MEINPTNLELIKIARELAYNDYNNRKAELHNQWLLESDIAWKKHKVKVAYPTIPEFPSEDEIINRAMKLIEFLNTHRPDLEEKIPEPQAEVQIEVEQPTEPESKPIIEQKVETTPEQPVTEQLIEPSTATVTEQTPQPAVQEPAKEEIKPELDLDYARMKVSRKIGDSYVSNRVIPSVIRKLQELRNSWK